MQAHDSGQDGDQHFLVMEHVEGQSLAALLRDKGPIPPTVAAGYVYQAALALQHAHEHGLIHRDVKPSNLLLAADGTVKLLDLGLARFLQDQISDPGLTREGVGMGTPDYASPEQFREARKADVRSDVYSLGCTLFTLIAGRVPFPGSSLSEKMEAHERKEPPPLEELCPEVPAGLALAVQKMMAKRPADRFQTAAEVSEALAPYVAGSSASFARVRNTTTWEGSRLGTMPDFRRRVRAALLPSGIAAAAVLVVLVAAVIAAFATGLVRLGGSEVVQAQTPTKPEPPDGTPGPPKPPDAPPKPVDPEDPNVLTVSIKPEDGGKYRTISAALVAVRPGQTVRVLDGGTYEESLAINRRTSHDGITLEAVRGATLRTRDLMLNNVSGVRVRGFRLQPNTAEFCMLIGVLNCHRLELEGLVFVPSAKGGAFLGLEMMDLASSAEAEPTLTVRGCSFRRALIGIHVAGMRIDAGRYGRVTPVENVVIQDNRFDDCNGGVVLKGELRRVLVAGNRITGAMDAAISLDNLQPKTDQVVVANNTIFESNLAVHVWDESIKTKGVKIANNLCLGGRGRDMKFVDNGGSPQSSKGDGDGTQPGANWQFVANWREVPEPPPSKGWIPPGPRDVRQDKIDGVEREPKSANFLRPAKDSLLATKGAGGRPVAAVLHRRPAAGGRRTVGLGPRLEDARRCAAADRLEGRQG